MSPVPIISPRASVLDIFIHWFSFLLYVIIKAILHFFYRFLKTVSSLVSSFICHTSISAVDIEPANHLDALVFPAQ